MSTHLEPYNLTSSYLRLRPDVSVEPLAVDGEFWPKIMAGRLGDFRNEYLVVMHDMDSEWTTWEVHPHGDEIVSLISGHVDFTLEHDSENRVVTLRQSGDYVLVPKGTWHTAKAYEPSTVLFITACEGTHHRPVKE
jgi:mannose-6-phosphate isomerase-like protein (cupin superfamily)